LCIDTYLSAVEAGTDRIVVRAAAERSNGEFDKEIDLPLVAEPNRMLFGMVIDAWSVYTKYHKDSKGPEKAEALLRRMIQYSESGKMNRVHPNTIIYNSVIHGKAVAYPKLFMDGYFVLVHTNSFLRHHFPFRSLESSLQSKRSTLESFGNFRGGKFLDAESDSTTFFLSIF
jgi:hypothetical protein